MDEMACSCCGTVAPHSVVQLNCHPEIVICDSCLDWLNTKRGEREPTRATIANTDLTFRVADVSRAAAHYKWSGSRPTTTTRTTRSRFATT